MSEADMSMREGKKEEIKEEPVPKVESGKHSQE